MATTTTFQGYPQQPQPQPQQHHHQPTTVEEVRTLWIGDLQYWVDENYLNSCFAHTGEVISIKIIRNKITGQPEGYGFVEFVSHAAAERILQSYNGSQMPGTEQTFRLNWASFGIGERRPDAGPEHSIFVGDLAPDVTDYLLQETFRSQYPSVRGAKVVTDPNTGRSKGYGFVKFSDETERNRAMTEMNGVYCSTRPMRISAATPKKTTGFQQPYTAAKAYSTPAAPVLSADYDANNTTIFVGNLDQNITEEELKQTFLQFGEIVYVKIPAGKGCGFIQFGIRTSAEEAIQKMQGKMIGQQIVRVSWGRSPTAKQDASGGWGQQVDPNQWAAYYGYGQGYDAYSYGASTQDPSLYAYSAYAGYAQYPQQVDGVQDMAAIGATVPAVEQREELDDPLATPDVDKLNAAYLTVHGSAMLGRPLWQRTSSFLQQT
ncbi:polyadenylate-binding protein RBP47B' isoform X2 [Humulus lupulus]|uniref:polyadenylate-binding protein RBP47B' isoform X2 n=1 Tax=Humulus lupulus TaxID=3486 RepID=UPI002B41069E|nr:polyadenylate-binding protein RBP47B' isoform X2 [Humulus lupulus]